MQGLSKVIKHTLKECSGLRATISDRGPLRFRHPRQARKIAMQSNGLETGRFRERGDGGGLVVAVFDQQPAVRSQTGGGLRDQ